MSDPLQQELADVVAPYGDEEWFEKRRAGINDAWQAKVDRERWCLANGVKPGDDIESLRLRAEAQQRELNLYRYQTERVVHAALRAARTPYQRTLCRQNGEAGARIAELRAENAGLRDALAPRRVGTAEELDALPLRTVAIEPDTDHVWIRHSEKRHCSCDGTGVEWTSAEVVGDLGTGGRPLTVVWLPEES